MMRQSPIYSHRDTPRRDHADCQPIERDTATGRSRFYAHNEQLFEGIRGTRQ